MDHPDELLDDKPPRMTILDPPNIPGLYEVMKEKKNRAQQRTRNDLPNAHLRPLTVMCSARRHVIAQVLNVPDVGHVLLVTIEGMNTAPPAGWPAGQGGYPARHRIRDEWGAVLLDRETDPAAWLWTACRCSNEKLSVALLRDWLQQRRRKISVPQRDRTPPSNHRSGPLTAEQELLQGLRMEPLNGE